jgi:IS605 OrfB family transposase
MILRRDCVKIQSQKGSAFKWWIRIPLHPESVWVPIELPHEQEPLLRYNIRECKLVRDDARWFVNITVQKEARLKRRYATILPIDMGIRKLATTIEDGKPKFYGKEIRRTRGNYFRLRRSAGKARIIKRWKHKERETLRHQVHAITRRIVNTAKRNNAIIAIGDLKAIRSNGKRKGRSFNRRLSSQPFHLFKRCVTYKANWEGIRVIEVPEASHENRLGDGYWSTSTYAPSKPSLWCSQDTVQGYSHPTLVLRSALGSAQASPPLG